MSIADKLLTVAENQKTVFDAGYNKGYEEGLKNAEPDPSQLEGILITDGRKKLYRFFEDLGPWEFYRYEWNDDAQMDVPVENELTPIDIPFPAGTKNIKDFSNFATTTAYLYDYPEDIGIPVRNFTGTLDAAGAKSFSSAFTNCKYLEDGGNIINTSGVENFNSMYGYCPNLKRVCELDLSSATNVDYMFTGCTELEEVSLVNIPALTGYYALFQGCEKLKSFPTFDFSKTYSYPSMFRSCKGMVTAPENIGIADKTNMNISYLFRDCINLKTVPCITINPNTTCTDTFYNCPALENITFKGLIGKTISFSTSPLLTHDSLMSIINALQPKTSGTFKLMLGATNLAKLTDEEKLMITNKGWQVS